MKTYTEVDAYNEGKRDVILVTERKLEDVIEEGRCARVAHNQWLVYRDSLDGFHCNLLIQSKGKAYGLGIILGYPPLCVEWYSKTERTELAYHGTLYGGSFSFKCPEHLIPYARAYMANTHKVVGMYYREGKQKEEKK